MCLPAMWNYYREWLCSFVQRKTVREFQAQDQIRAMLSSLILQYIHLIIQDKCKRRTRVFQDISIRGSFAGDSIKQLKLCGLYTSKFKENSFIIK